MMFATHRARSSSATLSSTRSGSTIPRGGGLDLSPEAVARAVEQEFEDLDYISERKLRKLSGEEDLTQVKKLTLSIDTREHSLSLLGHLTPNLRELKLTDSVLRSFRDLGTSLKNLRILHASKCKISDLDGISVLPGLEELYVPFNKIQDVTPLAMHEHLQVLDLEGNCIDDFQQVDQLSTCDVLTSLVLNLNPVKEVVHYRRAVAQLVPRLTSLDDEDIVDQDRQRLNETQMTQVFQNERKPKPTRKSGGSGRGNGGSGGGGSGARRNRTKNGGGGNDDSSDGSRASSPYDDEADVVNSLQGDNLQFHDGRGADHHHQQQQQQQQRRRGGGASSGESKTDHPSGEHSGRGRSGSRPMGGRSFVSKSTEFASGSMVTRPPSNSDGSEEGPQNSDKKGKGQSSSSELTHGADIVFAGSAVTALRRRRRDMKSGSQPSSSNGGNGGSVRGASKSNSSSRPLTAPDRSTEGREEDVSITATLDRAQSLENEMVDKNTSVERRMQILTELRSWRPDDDNTSTLLRASMFGSPGSRRPSSSSSAPATPDVTHQKYTRGGGSAGKIRRATRQPGQTAGVLVEWPGKRSSEKKKLEHEKKEARRRRRKRQEQEQAEEEEAAANRDESKYEEEPATSPSSSSSSTFTRSPTSTRYLQRRYVEEEEEEEEDPHNTSVHTDDDEDAKLNQQIAQLEKWGRRQGFRATESPPPTPRDGNVGNEEEELMYTSTMGVAGAREKTREKTREKGRSKRTMKKGGRSGSPNAAGDREEYRPLGSHFVVPSTNDDDDDDEIGGGVVEHCFKTIPTTTKRGHRSGGESSGNKGNKGNKGNNGKGGGRGGSGGRRRRGERHELDEDVPREEEGEALGRSDEELIVMLKLKPKRVPELRTEEGFQTFFQGINQKRMRRLLEMAYEHLKDREREKKVQRRLKLLSGHMTTV